MLSSRQVGQYQVPHRLDYLSHVRNTNPDLQLHYVRKFAKDLVVVLAFHLAETISALFRHVLDHPSKVLYDPETEPLFFFFGSLLLGSSPGRSALQSA